MPITRLIAAAETVALTLTAVLCIDAQQKSQERAPQHMSQNNGPVPASGNFVGLIDIGGGRKMHLECSGSGSPTVILESGYRNDADIWSAELEPGMSPVFSQVARFTRVCAYDRPGTFLDAEHLGRSTAVPMPRTARDLVSDLHTLLQAAHIPEPYVFAAHSFGGIFARVYASTYPKDVVGMVLVDALSEKVRNRSHARAMEIVREFWIYETDAGARKI
jgi:pimeloyl-ACP methyl ester carboxylesterase